MSPALLLFAAAMFGAEPGAVKPPAPAPSPTKLPRVAFETSLGRFVVEMEPAKAPKTVENFLAYAKAGFFDGTIFHRVMPGFMVQGGGFTADMTQKDVNAPIANEADNGLKNTRGTLAMARTNDPNSATAQFFVNLVDNAFLDHTGKNPRGWGYAVFARVVEGMEVIDKIATVKTGTRGPHANVPLEAVTIQKATILQ